MTYGNYPDLSQVKKALVIKLRHHGDVLLTSPVFSNLAAAIPGVEIDAMVYEETIPMLEGHPAIRKFVTYNRKWKKLGFLKRISRELSLLSRIRQEKYDLVINLTEGDRGAIAALASRAKIRVGLDPERKGFAGKAGVFTHLVKMCKTPRHTVEKNLDALRRIGIFPTPEERDLYFHIPDESRRKVEQSGRYFLLHPVSRWRFKCWPSSLVAKLIQELHQRGHKVLMTASPDAQEIKMCEEILAQIPEIPVINLAGKTSLKELGALIDMSECLICVDSVPLHIGSALKKQTVVLFGPTSEINWGPWQNSQARIVAQQLSCRPCFMDGCGGSKMSDCLATLPLKRVMDAIESLQKASCQLKGSSNS
jgi:heptosyltransferase-3